MRSGRAELVMAIVEALLGKAGMIIFGVVVGLACVTTAIGLTSSAAAYFTELCSEKVPYKAFVIVICVFSAVASNLGLDRIVSIAAPVLTSFIRRHWSLSSSRSLSPMQMTMSAAARLSAQLARASCVRSRSPQWRIFPCTTWACTDTSGRHFRPARTPALQQSSSPGSPKRKQKSDIPSHEPQLVAFCFRPEQQSP